jgi:hypothetical protein
MRVIPQTWCQIQHTSLSILYLNCGPGHIECYYSSAYSVFNIRLNVPGLLLEISRQFNERYAANSMPNTAHDHQFTQCERWSRTYSMHLQLRIFRLQYSSERTFASVEDISIIQWELYFNLGAKYSARSPVYAMLTVVPDMYNVITVTYIQASIFRWTYLRCYWRYSDNSMRAIL